MVFPRDKINSGDITFDNCVITVIAEKETKDMVCYTIYLNETDTRTLKSIQEENPDARLITAFVESALAGIVLRYGNHGKYWELIGKTEGYA